MSTFVSQKERRRTLVPLSGQSHYYFIRAAEGTTFLRRCGCIVTDRRGREKVFVLFRGVSSKGFRVSAGLETKFSKGKLSNQN